MNTGTDTYYLNSSEITSAINSYETYLSDVSTQSSNVMSTLDDFSSSSMNILIGDTWDEIRGNLDKYSDCLEVSEAINSEIIATNSECLKMIQDFLQPDNDLDTSKLSQYEKERDDLQAQIDTLNTENENLEKENEELENDPGEPIYDKNGNIIKYDDSKNKENIRINNEKIAKNIEKITKLTKERDEKIYFINKINKFNNEILPAVMRKLEESEKNLKLLMDKVDKIGLSALKSYSPKTGKAEKTYDLNTREGRFLYIYDQLTEKYGYSEWGAKAVLAQMYGTNDQFLSNRFQADLPTNAGYGLCQWEYKKYGGTVDDAQMMEDWCRSKGLDHTSIDGQLAWLDHYLPIKCADYKDLECYNKFKTATEADYYELVCKFGTYHQGSQGDQYKNYNRAYNGNLLYKLFPLIEERDSYKTATATSLSSSPKTDVAATTKASDTTAGNTYIPSTSSSSSSSSSAATATALVASAIPVSAAVASNGFQSNNSDNNSVPYNTLSSLSSTSTLSNNYMYDSTNSSPNVISSNNRESVYDIGSETGISTDTTSKTEISNKTVPVYSEEKKSDNVIVNTNKNSETEPSSNIKTVFEERKEFKSEPVKTNTTYKYEPVSSNDIESIIEEDEADNESEDIIGTYYTTSSNNPDSVYVEERKDNNTEPVDNKEITTANNNSNNKNNNPAKTILTAVGTTAAIGAAAGAAIYGVKQSKKNNEFDEDEVFEEK